MFGYEQQLNPSFPCTVMCPSEEKKKNVTSQDINDLLEYDYLKFRVYINANKKFSFWSFLLSSFYYYILL